MCEQNLAHIPNTGVSGGAVRSSRRSNWVGTDCKLLKINFQLILLFFVFVSCQLKVGKPQLTNFYRNLERESAWAYAMDFDKHRDKWTETLFQWIYQILQARKLLFFCICYKTKKKGSKNWEIPRYIWVHPGIYVYSSQDFRPHQFQELLEIKQLREIQREREWEREIEIESEGESSSRFLCK